MYAQVLKEADIIITLNHKIANLIKEIIPSNREVNIIRDGGDMETTDTLIQPKPERYKEKKIILSVGALTERKGHEYLIRAINYIKDELPDIKCIIIGSGVRLRSLENLINKLLLNNTVELYGKRSHNEVLKTMSWCDVFVLPSWDEGFGTVYSEAMTFAKPIIACIGEGIGEVVQDGLQGLLVKRQNVESLAEALKRILGNENLCSSLGREARILVKRELNWNGIASQIIDSYKSIIV